MKSINSLIADRKSELAFLPADIPSNELMLLFEAARWAPSSYNEQPWQFYFAPRQNSAGFNKMLQLLSPGNQEWAKNASVLIISTAKKLVTRNGIENFYAMHDVALAEANLILQAQSMGLSSHIMGGFDREESKKRLQLSDEYFPLVVIAVGQPGDVNSLSPQLQKRAQNPRTRKPLESIAFEIV